MSGKLVNVIATVDLQEGMGKILYVNPVSSDARADAMKLMGEGMPTTSAGSGKRSLPWASKFELRVEDSSGRPMVQVHPRIKISDCEVRSHNHAESGGEPQKEVPTTAMINEFIPVIDGMASVILLYDGVEKDRFRSGLKTAQEGGMGLAFPDAPDGSHRRTLDAAAGTSPEAGVSYTVQVMPDGAKLWQTIAVGRDSAVVQLDRNQFPGAKKARVRVLRSTGFDSTVFAEDDVRFDF